jgi:hypothetical protein
VDDRISGLYQDMALLSARPLLSDPILTEEQRLKNTEPAIVRRPGILGLRNIGLALVDLFGTTTKDGNRRAGQVRLPDPLGTEQMTELSLILLTSTISAATAWAASRADPCYYDDGEYSCNQEWVLGLLVKQGIADEIPMLQYGIINDAGTKWIVMLSGGMQW